MCRLICAFVVPIWHKRVFSRCGSNLRWSWIKNVYRILLIWMIWLELLHDLHTKRQNLQTMEKSSLRILACIFCCSYPEDTLLYYALCIFIFIQRCKYVNRSWQRSLLVSSFLMAQLSRLMTKPTKWLYAQSDQSLRCALVWSESSLCA